MSKRKAYTLFYVWDSTSHRRVFYSEANLKKFIKEFPTNEDGGCWLDFWVPGEINYLGY